MTIHVLTSAAANYLPKVRALFDSVRRHHPDWRLNLVLADAPQAGDLEASGADALVTLDDLAIPQPRAWVFAHSLIELATAIKPMAMAGLLRQPDCEAVVYFDPDVALYSPVEEVEEALGRADILLTPHQTTPATTVEDVVALELCTAQHGIYNLGFIAVRRGPNGRAFADWWARRCYQFCREDIPNGLYTDQRWLDFAAAYFEGVEVLRQPNLNVAPWNLAARGLEGDGAGYLAGGEPLRFFHFSAVDRDPKAMTRHGPAAEALLAGYLAATPPEPQRRWAFDAFSDGEPITPAQRHVYRLRADLQQAFPDPFQSGQGTFQAWWREQATGEFPALFNPATAAAEEARLASAVVTGFAPWPGR